MKTEKKANITTIPFLGDIIYPGPGPSSASPWDF